jgi:hypothetical protein
MFTVLLNPKPKLLTMNCVTLIPVRFDVVATNPSAVPRCARASLRWPFPVFAASCVNRSFNVAGGAFVSRFGAFAGFVFTTVTTRRPAPGDVRAFPNLRAIAGTTAGHTPRRVSRSACPANGSSKTLKSTNKMEIEIDARM